MALLAKGDDPLAVFVCFEEGALNVMEWVPWTAGVFELFEVQRPYPQQ